jgi:pilus assembly protein CpaC
LSGGIVYLPIVQSTGTGGNVITLQPQNYGVGVKFTPTVLAEGRINLKVSPQVSEVQSQGITVTAGSSTTVFPSITTRQASTTVQLYDGQSFAIGGLIKNNVVEIISAFPGLANIPIIGALFRSSSFKADRSELLIVVTPHIVKPLNQRPGLPTDKIIQPTATEFFIEGKLEGAPKEATEKNDTSIEKGGKQ